jgi:predicted acetyltransferase
MYSGVARKEMIVMIEVAVAPESEKDSLWPLFREYALELAEYDSEKRPCSSRHYPCFDLFWQDESRTPFEILYDHEPVGFCFLEDTGVSYRICEFYIRPVHRRRGFGKIAVEYIHDFCLRMGRHEVLAADIYVNNEPAVRFWQSLGFQDTGRRTRIKHVRLMETEMTLKTGAKT